MPPSPASAIKPTRRERAVLIACLAGGLLLFAIGVRYLTAPEAAALTFGIPRRPQAFELHYVTGLRNIWLGALAFAFAVFKEWRALALWFGFAALVCFADAWIAASSVGGWAHVAFHAGCGIASAVLSALALRAFLKGS